jgi:hypothetical protein
MGPAAGEAREDATWKAIGRTDDCRAAGRRPPARGWGNTEAKVTAVPRVRGVRGVAPRLELDPVLGSSWADSGLVIAAVAACEGVKVWLGECCRRPTCMITTVGQARWESCRDCHEC